MTRGRGFAAVVGLLGLGLLAAGLVGSLNESARALASLVLLLVLPVFLVAPALHARTRAG